MTDDSLTAEICIWYAVRRSIGNVKNRGAELIQPVWRRIILLES